MRLLFKITSILCLLAIASPAFAKEASGRIIKVLPHLLDVEGRHTLSPSLYERDAYQAKLRSNPDLVSGVRYDIEWNAKNTGDRKLILRIELRSDVREKLPGRKTLEKEVTDGIFGQWSSILLTGDDFKKFGQVTAWRVTLWDGDKQIAEQTSFLW